MKDTPDQHARHREEARLEAAEQYRLDHNPAYREHTARRREAAMIGREDADRLYPAIDEIRRAHKHARVHLRQWDKANPNPLTWDEYRRLNEAFDASYEADRS